jgi:hypothetical protein
LALAVLSLLDVGKNVYGQNGAIQAVGQNVLGKIQAADDVTRGAREVEGKS